MGSSQSGSWSLGPLPPSGLIVRTGVLVLLRVAVNVRRVHRLWVRDQTAAECLGVPSVLLLTIHRWSLDIVELVRLNTLNFLLPSAPPPPPPASICPHTHTRCRPPEFVAVTCLGDTTVICL